MSDFGNLSIWSEPGLRGRMPWYRAVADNKRPAKFQIARHIPVDVSLDEASEDYLWDALADGTDEFLNRWRRIQGGQEGLPTRAPDGPNLLDLCRELTNRMLRHCNFCRWNCGVDRAEGAKFGTCKLAEESRVSTYFHHLGEELVYRGSRGSGTIFFTSCNMRCAFCQNGDISTDKDNGRGVTPRQLATMAWLLRMEGCHNINWVGGEVTIHLHTIVEAISLLDEIEPTREELGPVLPQKADYFLPVLNLSPRDAQYQGVFNAPMLWNSNFFMSEPAMRILRVLMDVWLPDFKFGPGRCGVTLSKTPWYWETVTENLKKIHDWGEDFTIRHLVMPGHVECCTRPVLEWVAEYMPEAAVNVMDQYHPDNFCDPRSSKYDDKYEAIARRPTRGEIEGAYQIARELEITFEGLTFEKQRSRYGF